MDKSHRYRKPHHASAKQSVDGFLSPEHFKQSSGSIGFPTTKKSDKSAVSSQKLDDFNRPSGYHPSNSSLEANIKNAPILPDGPRRPADNKKHSGQTKPPKKRRFLHRPKSWPKFIAKTMAAGLIVLLFIGGYLGYKLFATQKRVLSGGGHAVAVCDGNIPVNLLKKEGDARVNVLLVGVGGPGHDGPDLTDTMIIASVDTINNKVDLLSIPRDLWVQNYSGGSNKLNAIYPFAKQASSTKSEKEKDQAGLKVLDRKISQISGLTIHYNVLVNFKAFKDSVNAVGGVTVKVPETLYDPTIAWENNYNPTIAPKGVQQFNGQKALLYAKSRETSSDFARGERQRLLLVALKDKVLSLGTFSNPLKVSNLLDTFGNNVYTDFDISSVKCLYKQVSEIQSSNIKSLDLVKPPHDLLTTGPINGQSTVYPKAGLYDYSAIRLFVGSTLRDSELAKENAGILILNGTNYVGLATKQANLLKAFGYRVVKTGDAPSRNYQNTIIVDLRNGLNKYTKNYLQNRFGVRVSNKLPDNAISPDSADFVIILGNDAINNIQN